MRPSRVLLGLCAALTTLAYGPAVAQPRLGEGVVYKDRFLGKFPLGTVALVAEDVPSVDQAKKVLILQRETPVQFNRRVKCRALIAHFDLDLKGTETFVGIQLLRVFRVHEIPGTVYVSRNSGWFSRNGKTRLDSLEPAKEVKVASLGEFAKMHSNLDDLHALSLMDGARVEDKWHAGLRRNQGDTDDTAGDAHRTFWARNALLNTTFKDRYKQSIDKGATVRVENRLMRFTVTDSLRSSSAPNFNFDCFDPSLLSVAMRVYIPLSQDNETWYFVDFEKGPL